MAEALIDNHGSHAVHRALGFAETGRVVFFRRKLA
jgi:RimJ/RimL family protein N-acetyltransferase